MAGYKNGKEVAVTVPEPVNIPDCHDDAVHPVYDMRCHGEAFIGQSRFRQAKGSRGDGHQDSVPSDWYFLVLDHQVQRPVFGIVHWDWDPNVSNTIDDVVLKEPRGFSIFTSFMFVEEKYTIDERLE